MSEVLGLLKEEPDIMENEQVQSGIKDMKLLLSYLEAMDVLDKVSFDLSLARGLDYYSGLIYEVIVNEPNQVGSVAAGGRYDNLVGMYGKQQVPCIGVSFGIDRIFTILDKRRKQTTSSNLQRKADVYVIAAGGKDGDGFLVQRMEIARLLWDAGIQAEYTAKVKPKLQSQFNASKEVPITIILGQDEIDAGQVRLKEIGRDDEKDRGRLVEKRDVVKEVKKLLGA